MAKFKDIITLKTIGSKLILSALIGLVLFSTITQSIVASTIRSSEISHVEEKERSDLAYMEDYLGEGEWRVENYTLYKGDLSIGDGSEANANKAPFQYVTDNTGSFFYTFLHIDYVRPLLSSTIPTKEGSSYLRVAGSTTNPDATSIVGTYMEANVSAKLDKDGEFLDYAIVEKSRYHTLYQTIKSGDDVIGAIVVGRSVDAIHTKIREANIRIIIFIAVAFLLTMIVISMVIVSWIKAIKKSQNHLQCIANGVFPEKPLVVKTRDEIEEMANIINDMTSSLKDKERIETELTLAKEIQINMLPKSFNEFSNEYFKIFASMEPAREVGGDFYDFFKIDDKNVVICIADVSGKGIPAALLMSIAKTMIKNLMISGYSVGECFTRINNIFSEGNEAGLFITSWLGLLNLETGLLTYVNAGHNPPLIYRKNKVYEYLKTQPGFVLGGLEGIKYRQAFIELKEGDRIFLYTDGVTEAHNESNSLYGEHRLINYLNSCINSPIDDVLNGLRKDINKFKGKAEQSDDITMLILDYLVRKDSFGLTKIFPADKEELYNCLDFINEQLESNGCTMKIQNQIDLVIEEIFMNIVNHGYQSVKGDIEVTVDITSTGVATFIIKDRGVPFNPLNRASPDISLSSDERSIGGLGIFISKQICDSLEYEFANGQNILTIKKKIKE